MLGYKTWIDGIATSTNWGTTWNNVMSLGRPGWSSSAVSADGAKFIAAGSGICISTNRGQIWTGFFAPGLIWSALAASSDGARLAAGSFTYDNGDQRGAIYTSTDSGATWTSNNVVSNFWSSIAASADGCNFVAAARGGGIYTWQTTPSPKLNITPSGSGLLISWTVPSMPFVLQESFDLASATWIDVPTSPTLNFTNLHHEVSVPLSITNRFYRLKLLGAPSQ